ncbi:response regulator transcription factor [Spirosoma litoris]
MGPHTAKNLSGKDHCDYRTDEIAERLSVSIRTVDGHRANLLEKTNARNTAGLVLFAIKNRLLDLADLL